MHQLRDYNHFCNGITPVRYRFVQNAFTIGSAVDFGIKTYYMNKMQDKKPYGDNVLDSDEFKRLPNKIDQTMVMALLDAYIEIYGSKELYHTFKIENWKVPVSIKKAKHDFLIYTSPDLTALTYHENKKVIIEIKTSGDEDNTLECLDFQTMTYAWACYKWDFTIPEGVLKRVIMKPRIRQKKDETISEFQKRLIYTVADAEQEKYFKSTFKPVTLNMIKEFELYLIEILKDIDTCMAGGNKYKFWKRTNEYWGV